MNPSTTAQTYKKTSTKSEYSLKLYYDIKKQNNGKFLIIRFSYFIGDYLEIEQTRANCPSYSINSRSMSLMYALFSYLQVIFILVVLIPYISLSVRRLHDIGKSGWYILIVLIPIVGIFIF